MNDSYLQSYQEYYNKTVLQYNISSEGQKNNDTFAIISAFWFHCLIKLTYKDFVYFFSYKHFALH